jgi:hypothetical protein
MLIYKQFVFFFIYFIFRVVAFSFRQNDLFLASHGLSPSHTCHFPVGSASLGTAVYVAVVAGFDATLVEEMKVVRN